MDIFRILISGFVATSIMTAFSYILSNIRNQQFREPELLNLVLSQSDLFRLELSRKSIAGWIIHYSIGWMFVAVFTKIWELDLIPSSLLWGAVLGFAAGIVGIFGWKILFSLSTKAIKIKLSEYYLQLIFAHIIFGICAAIVYETL